MLGESAAQAAYVLAFTVAALGCFGALPRANRVEDDDTSRGLVWLLACSGAWAAFQALFLVVPGSGVKYAAYTGTLVVGLATVGAWLYFASAYTGRSFHREGTYRRVALGTYLAIVTVKLTNPIHGLYFRTEMVSDPFVHLAVRHATLHWVVTGLSYALVAVGFFMLYELFLEADYDTRPLLAVVGVTGLPAVLDVVGYATPLLLDVNHESLGVAAFAVGALFVFEERFLSVQVTGDVEDAVVFLDDAGRIRDFNRRARSVFPELAGSVGEDLTNVVPALPAAAAGDDVLERDVASSGEGQDPDAPVREDETRYFLVSESSFTLGQTDVGRVFVATDVTSAERRRRELERQNDQLEGLAAAIRHELRNTLQVVRGRVDIAGDALETGDVTLARESFETASETADRMDRVVDDLSALAQYGQTLERTERVPFREVVNSAWRGVETGDLELTVEGDGTVEAEWGRLRELLGNAVEFATHNGATRVTVSLRDGGFAVTDDGRPPGDVAPGTYFEYGGSVPHAETGVTLPNLRTLARVHGWETSIDHDYRDGFRVVVSGVTVDRRAARRQAA